MTKFGRSLAMLSILLSLLCAVAQSQDPFGAESGLDTDSVVSEEPKTPKGKADKRALDVAERNAVVLSLRANPPKNQTELARAVMLMARIQRWDEVRHWMDEIGKAGITDASSLQMVQSVGSQAFLQLLNPSVPITDAHRASAQKILDFANTHYTDPKKLAGAVLQLKSQNKNERLQGFQKLKSAGNFGIAALLNHLLSEQATAPNPTMCEAFSLLGKEAHSAWLAAMTTPNAQARGRLALLAVRLGESDLTTALCTAALDARVDSEVRDELANIAKQNNKSIPSAQLVHRYAMNQLQKAMLDYQRIRWQDEADAFTVWHLSNDGTKVTDRNGQFSDTRWSQAVQYAYCALRTGEAADVDSAQALAVIAENAMRVAPESASMDSVSTMLPALLRDSYEFACLVWDASEKLNLASAQLLAIKNLSRWAMPESMPNEVRERLAKGCRSGHPAVRYAAAEAFLSAMTVTDADGTTRWSDIPFDGRNRLERILMEMRLLDDKPMALVIGGNSELRTHAKELLESFAFRVIEASSAAQTFEQLKRGQPIESILIVEHVLEMDLGQLIQRIRMHPSAGACPIALLADSLSRGEHSVAGSDPGVVMGSLPPEQAGLADILRRMRVVTQAPTVDSASRIVWSDLANAYWNGAPAQFVSAAPRKSYQPIVESPAGQQHLLSIVLDNSYPMPDRVQASQIFVQSLEQFGLLMSTETTNAQYDEYIERAPEEPELRETLKQVLDAIESTTGKRPGGSRAP